MARWLCLGLAVSLTRTSSASRAGPRDQLKSGSSTSAGAGALETTLGSATVVAINRMTRSHWSLTSLWRRDHRTLGQIRRSVPCEAEAAEHGPDDRSSPLQ